MEQNQFDRRPIESPHLRLRNFLAKCDIIKLNGITADAIKLKLFPFSLKDRASDSLLNEEQNSIATWEALSKVFLSKYFPLSKTTKLRTKITSFVHEMTSLYMKHRKDLKIFTSMPAPWSA